MVDTVRVRYKRRIPYAPDVAYDWLTDYDDQDHERAGAIIQHRTVRERGEDHVILDAQLATVGRSGEGWARVELAPDDHAWTAHLHDTKDRHAGTYEYRLRPAEDGTSSVLEVDYHIGAPKLKHKLMLYLAKPLVRREIDKMWDGFFEAMARDMDEQADEVPAKSASA